MKRKTLPAIVLALTGVLFLPGFPLAQGGGPDGFGYTWVNSVPPDPLTNFGWLEISSTGKNSGVSGDDNASGLIPTGFDFPFYGQTFNQLAFSTNGIVTFGGTSSQFSNPSIPSTDPPNNFIAVFFDDLNVRSDGAIYYQQFPAGAIGSPDKGRAFVVEWFNVGYYCCGGHTTFEVILFENGEIKIQHLSVTGPKNSATVGIENSQGTLGLQYNFNGTGEPIGDGIAVLFVPPACPPLSPPPSPNYTQLAGTFDWLEISSTGTNSEVSGDDSVSGLISMGFNFPFYGQTFNRLAFSTNGIVTFGGADTAYFNTPIPFTASPNNFIAVFFDDLFVYTDGAIYHHQFPAGEIASADKGSAFVVEWSNVGYCCSSSLGRATFEVILFENGEIKIQHLSVTGPKNSATVGIENSQGTIGLQYNFNGTGEPIGDGIAVLFVPPTTGQPPVITLFCATPRNGAAPSTVNFNLATSDPDGSIASIQWDFNGDGITDASDVVNQPTASLSRMFTYLTAGTFTASVTVIDNTGATTSASTSVTVFSDSIPPTTTAMVTPPANAAGWNNTDVTVTLTATDNPGGFGIQSITYSLTGAQSGGGSVNASTASFTITAEGTTTVTFHARDNAGNVEADETLIVRIDKTVPTVSSSSINRADANPTNAASVSWTVTFSEAVTGVDATDFALAASGVTGASITSVTGGPTVYTVTASTGSGDGTLGLNLVDDDSIQDAATNKLEGTGANNGNFTGQVYTIDTTPPTATLTLTPGNLWPPNHKMVAITPTLTTSDLAGPVTISGPTVTSNEPVDGLGDGDTSPDWIVSGTNGVQLRAERGGRGNGRIYTITYVVTDQSGNSTTVSATVMVPKSQGK